MRTDICQDEGTKTLVVKCPDGTDSSRCGFPTPANITAGPSTLALATTVQNTLTVNLKCKVEGSTKADCTQVYIRSHELDDLDSHWRRWLEDNHLDVLCNIGFWESYLHASHYHCWCQVGGRFEDRSSGSSTKSFWADPSRGVDCKPCGISLN